LDRFAQFFISSLCLPSAVDRELLAVDNEGHRAVRRGVNHMSKRRGVGFVPMLLLLLVMGVGWMGVCMAADADDLTVPSAADPTESISSTDYVKVLGIPIGVLLGVWAVVRGIRYILRDVRDCCMEWPGVVEQVNNGCSATFGRWFPSEVRDGYSATFRQWFIRPWGWVTQFYASVIESCSSSRRYRRLQVDQDAQHRNGDHLALSPLIRCLQLIVPLYCLILGAVIAWMAHRSPPSSQPPTFLVLLYLSLSPIACLVIRSRAFVTFLEFLVIRHPSSRHDGNPERFGSESILISGGNTARERKRQTAN